MGLATGNGLATEVGLATGLPVIRLGHLQPLGLLLTFIQLFILEELFELEFQFLVALLECLWLGWLLWHHVGVGLSVEVRHSATYLLLDDEVFLEYFSIHHSV